MNLDRISRTLVKMTRHDPKPLTMCDKGWIDVEDILNHFNITLDELELIVDSNDKKRLSFNKDFTKLCANQGHSSNVAVNKELKEIKELDNDLILYHGTSLVAYNIIMKDCIKPGKRQHVHWTTSLTLANKRSNQKAGWDKSKPVIITLNAKHFINNSGKLYHSENDVYLTLEINNKFLNKLEQK